MIIMKNDSILGLSHLVRVNIGRLQPARDHFRRRRRVLCLATIIERRGSFNFVFKDFAPVEAL